MATVRTNGRLSGTRSEQRRDRRHALAAERLDGLFANVPMRLLLHGPQQERHDGRIVEMGDGFQGFQPDLRLGLILPVGLMLLVPLLQFGKGRGQRPRRLGHAGLRGPADAVQGLGGADEQPAVGDGRRGQAGPAQVD